MNMDHADDFISVLNSLSKIIEHNIAHHLLLDVGEFLRQIYYITVTTMRYDQTSKYFWLLVNQGKGHAYTLLPRKQWKITTT